MGRKEAVSPEQKRDGETEGAGEKWRKKGNGTERKRERREERGERSKRREGSEERGVRGARRRERGEGSEERGWPAEGVLAEGHSQER